MMEFLIYMFFFYLLVVLLEKMQSVKFTFTYRHEKHSVLDSFL